MATSDNHHQADSIPPVEIVQRDDGAYAIGWHDDAPGPFSSRSDAIAVAQVMTEMHVIDPVEGDYDDDADDA
jgi:hypothetical protein